MKKDAKSHQTLKEIDKQPTPHFSRQNRRRNSEHELEKHLQRAMSIGRIFSWEMNPATREIKRSNNMEDVIGFPLFDNIDKTFELFHPDDGKYAIDAINKAIETRVEYESEYRLVNPQNGEVFWFHSQGAITTNNADGNPRFIGITQNITERKQAEEALCQSEEQAHLLIESATDFAIFRVALDNRIASWNTGAEKVFGYAESEIIG